MIIDICKNIIAIAGAVGFIAISTILVILVVSIAVEIFKFFKND